MVIIARMLARKTVVLGIVVAALFMVVSTFAGPSRAEQLVASWYGVGDGFAGKTTANQETFDPYAYTAAHKTLPFGTKLAVTYEGRTAVVRINDRGPYIEGRDLDLSYAAADYIGLVAVGSAPVNVEYVDASTPVGPYQESAPEPAPEPAFQSASEPAPEPAPEPAASEPQPAPEPAPETERQTAPEPEEAVTPEPAQPERRTSYFALQSPSEELAQSPGEGQYEEAPADDQYEEEEADEQATRARGQQAADDQYENPAPAASGDQYADEDQYDDSSGQQPSGQSATPPAQPAPEQPALQQAAPQQTAPGPSPATVAPEASELEEPPAELVTPGSTVEHRVEIEIAAAPGTATEAPDTPDLAPVPVDQYADPGAEIDERSPEQPAGPEDNEAQDSAEPASGETQGSEPPADPASEEAQEPAGPASEEDTAEEQDSGEVQIERLPDTGGWAQIPRVSLADMVAVLMVAAVLKAGLSRARA